MEGNGIWNSERVARRFKTALYIYINIYGLLNSIRCLTNAVCPTRYRTRHFFNNSNTNEDITTKFEQEYVRCVRNEEECVCSQLQISLQYSR